MASDRKRIIQFWQRLLTLRRLELQCHSGRNSTTHWQGQGAGYVQIRNEKNNLWMFEQGQFKQDQQKRSMSFRNTYRWQLLPHALRLYHERHGAHAALWLFDLQMLDAATMVAVTPHYCGADTYHGCLTLIEQGCRLTWQIHGPGKADRVIGTYYA